MDSFVCPKARVAAYTPFILEGSIAGRRSHSFKSDARGSLLKGESLFEEVELRMMTGSKPIPQLTRLLGQEAAFDTGH